jgi:Fur family transcriptional regulator, peroxide stress response regulator
MTVAGAEIERRMRVLTEGLRASGMRLTHQRLEVAREVAASDTHPDVETIYQRVRERVPTVSLDTVYRTLTTLAETGLIDRVSTHGGPARYDANKRRHHHFVCARCGLVRDVDFPAVDALDLPGEALSLGSVQRVDVQFRGICKECDAAHTEGDER